MNTAVANGEILRCRQAAHAEPVRAQRWVQNRPRMNPGPGTQHVFRHVIKVDNMIDHVSRSKGEFILGVSLLTDDLCVHTAQPRTVPPVGLRPTWWYNGLGNQGCPPLGRGGRELVVRSYCRS